MNKKTKKVKNELENIKEEDIVKISLKDGDITSKIIKVGE